MKEILRPVLLSAFIGFTVSFLLNYFLIPVSETELANAPINFDEEEMNYSFELMAWVVT